MPRFFRESMRDAIAAPTRAMETASAEVPAPSESLRVRGARGAVLSGRWLNPRHDSSMPWSLPSHPAWSVVWSKPLRVGGDVHGIQLTRNRVLAHSAYGWTLVRARDGEHISYGRLGPSDVLVHPDSRSFFYESPDPAALTSHSMKDGKELFATILFLAGNVERTHLSVLPDGRFVAAGSAPRMSPQGRLGNIAGIDISSFGDPPRVNGVGILLSGERSQVLNHDARAFRVVRVGDGFLIAVDGAVAFADTNLELSSVVTTETAEPLWLSVDRADRGHLVLREPEGDFVYWLMSAKGDRLATARWPHADGAPIAPPVVSPDYHSYIISSHRIMCFDPVGASAWTVETAEAIGGAAVSFDGLLLVAAGSSVICYETVDGAVRSRVLVSLEGITLTSAPVLTSRGHMLVGSRDHLHALRSRRA